MMSIKLENKRPKGKDQCRRLLGKNLQRHNGHQSGRTKGRKGRSHFGKFFTVIKDSV